MPRATTALTNKYVSAFHRVYHFALSQARKRPGSLIKQVREVAFRRAAVFPPLIISTEVVTQ